MSRLPHGWFFDSRLQAVFALVAVVLLPACGGSSNPPRGRTVALLGGSFPPITIVGRYSAQGCRRDTRTLVDDARLFYVHSTGTLGPADLYYYDMRLAYAHFQADGCTSADLGKAIRSSLTARQRTFLLENVASDLRRAFQQALKST